MEAQSSVSKIIKQADILSAIAVNYVLTLVFDTWKLRLIDEELFI